MSGEISKTDYLMASSRGRERLRERTASGRIFVFGSSTPRDLSHMNKIPTKLRSYDAKVEVNHDGPDLREIMTKARSLTAQPGSGGRQWAFGSSTPRHLAHLTALEANLRRYDAPVPKKSATSPHLQSPSKRSITAPPANRLNKQLHLPEEKRAPKDDDISSEPDFVQDRAEFLKDLKQLSQNEKARREEVALLRPDSDGKKLSTGDIAEDATAFAHAAEIASIGSERVAEGMHEDESGTARHMMIHDREDQIVVAHMEPATPDVEHKAEGLLDKLAHIGEKAVDNVGHAVEAGIEEAKEIIHELVEDDVKSQTAHAENGSIINPEKPADSTVSVGNGSAASQIF